MHQIKRKLNVKIETKVSYFYFDMNIDSPGVNQFSDYLILN